MKVWQRALLIAGVLTVGGAELAWWVHSARQEVEQVRQAAARATAQRKRQAVALLPPAQHYTRAQTQDFLTAAKRAEAIADPLARCLAYPDPPGSHWAHDAVDAYCHYYFQPGLEFAEAKALIEQGKAAQLDRRLAAALHAQQTRPEARGLLDRIYLKAFQNGSFDLRPTLDAWKRQSPDSAFAWAASGTAYVEMAADARGSQYIADTPPSSLRAMDNLLAEAVVDLRQAIKLNPQLTPAHTALIHAAGMDSGEADVDAAIRDALAAVPDDYSIYSRAMWVRQPKWGGSLAAMDALASQAQAHVAANPMLKILLAERPYYQVLEAGLQPKAELGRYPGVLDRVASVPRLAWVGQLASNVRDFTAMAVYQSEVLRFLPENDKARANRAIALVDYDEAAWAVADMDRVLARSPQDAFARETRAYAYGIQEDYAHAEQDLLQLRAADPHDVHLQMSLGRLYLDWGSHWDKAWAIADEMIRERPQSPAGWLLRANIQQRQPRAGLDETAREIEKRFGSAPGAARMLLRMRADIALRKHTGIDAKPSDPSR